MVKFDLLSFINIYLIHIYKYAPMLIRKKQTKYLQSLWKIFGKYEHRFKPSSIHYLDLVENMQHFTSLYTGKENLRYISICYQ